MNIHFALIGLIFFGGIVGFVIGYLCGIIHQENVYKELRRTERKERRS